MSQMLTMLTNQLQNRLRTSNPNLFEKYEVMRQNNGNPTAIFNQITNGYSKEQMQGFMTFARNFGVPDEVLREIQNGIKP